MREDGGSLTSSGSNQSQPASMEPRMLERRVSNNRADLNNDQQMNFILAWFQEWSELEKDDFVPVLGDTLSSKHSHVNGISHGAGANNNQIKKRRPSLFDCQVSLYRTWIHGWSDDQKSYLIIRLKEIDQNFGKKYENFLQYGEDCPEKDYFEPGIPPELDRTSEKGSNPASLNTSVDDEMRGEIIFKVADNTKLQDDRPSRLEPLEKFEKLEIIEKEVQEGIEEGEDALQAYSPDIQEDDTVGDGSSPSSPREQDCLSPIAEGSEE
eukprot:TRINITY_DN13995_c0_g1_i5.p1 TRINITY_DN13995_c0_g1~~TRINITY_DN13995_c0_g1_i5.p1  ORF type:complete len:267 (-),score=71.69 TRINITY_DN13995_c0_g1_i5:387-1187(-)